MLKIGKVIAKVRTLLFTELVEWEIYHRIFPHLKGRANHGYPFANRVELDAQNVQGLVTVCTQFRDLEEVVARMPQVYGEAYRNIVLRDINARMKMYLELAMQRADAAEAPTVPVRITA